MTTFFASNKIYYLGVRTRRQKLHCRDMVLKLHCFFIDNSSTKNSLPNNLFIKNTIYIYVKNLIAAVDENITRIISYPMDKAGNEGITANSASVRQLQDILPDIVLLEECLDNYRVKELFRKLKENSLTHYKIILLSAETDIQNYV